MSTPTLALAFRGKRTAPAPVVAGVLPAGTFPLSLAGDALLVLPKGAVSDVALTADMVIGTGRVVLRGGTTKGGGAWGGRDDDRLGGDVRGVSETGGGA